MRQFVYWMFILVIVTAMGGSIAYAARPWVDAAKVVSDMTSSSGTVAAKPTFTYTPTPRATPSVVPATPTPTPPPIVNPKGRTNILLLASDNDSKFAGATWPNTQVMLFVSYDTVHQQVYMISIPRDLWVTISGYTQDKIDTASGYGGIPLAVQTVENSFHVQIQQWAWVGLTGFTKIIDTIGGINIDVTHPMVENDFPDDIQDPAHPYAIRRFYIPSGPQHLDGVTALQYVRARHADLIGDFGRSQRQQQVLLQVKDQLRNADILTLAPKIIEDLQGEFKTSMGLPEILGLARSGLALQSKDIHRYFLTQAGGYTTDKQEPTANGDAAALDGNWDKINALFSCVLSDAAAKTGCPAS